MLTRTGSPSHPLDMNPIAAIEKWIEDGMPMTMQIRLGIVVAVLVLFGGIFAYFVKNERPLTPCMPEGLPGRCYYVTEDMCNVIWDQATATCADYIKGLSLPPGRLTGPIEFNCKLARFDKAFRTNLKSEPECQQMIFELEDWIRRNDFNASSN